MSRTRKHKVDVDGRECSQCDKYKRWHEFSPGAGAHGKDTRCKQCMGKKGRARNARPEVQAAEHARWIDRWKAAHPGQEYVPRRAGRDALHQRVRRLGITEDQFMQLVEAAVFGQGLCDLHGGPETMKYKGGMVRGLSVDHAHGCDQGHPQQKCCLYCVRGLLCCECNRNVIRWADQWPELAKRFEDYLARRPLLEPGAPLQPDLQVMPKYKYATYNPGQYPDDVQHAFDAMSADGWHVNTAMPNYGEVYILWEKDDDAPVKSASAES